MTKPYLSRRFIANCFNARNLKMEVEEYLENSSNATTPDLPTKEPDNSLSMGDEHLDTISETESDEVIKSSVEDLVPILRGDVDEINDLKDGYYDSKGDILYLESLISNDTTPNIPPEVFLDRDLRILSDEPNINDLMTEDKVLNPGIHDQIFSPTYVSLPFEDRH
uniref:Reverse transcriptase domain-containing protein n=1 Tax=Tanacetum cinerariifolium TaxID=118510 RepID=A0A699HJD6_TANCI|nr:hypothetical protein [Tanacetum cinerariifolium]